MQIDLVIHKVITCILLMELMSHTTERIIAVNAYLRTFVGGVCNNQQSRISIDAEAEIFLIIILYSKIYNTHIKYRM